MRQFDDDEKTIKKALEQTQPEPPNLCRDVLLKVRNSEKRPARKRAKLIVAIALIVLIPAATVAAIAYSSYNKLLEDIPPEYSEYLEPVEAPYEQDGIRMELVAYTYSGNTLIAYINLEDTEGLGRITEELMGHMDFFSVSGSTGYSWSVANYDEEAGILTYKLEAELAGADKLTVSINDLYYAPVTYTQHDTGINLSEAYDIETQVAEVNASAFGLYKGVDAEYDIPEIDELSTLLAPGIMDIKIPGISCFKITNMGILDEKLHIQVWIDLSESASYFEIYLQDSDGNIIEPSFSSGYSHESGEYWEMGNCYWDYEFEVDLDNLSKYKLLTDATESPKLEGQWEVTIPIEEDEANKKTVECSFNLDGFEAERAVLTPFGLTLYGQQLDSTNADSYFDLAAVVDCGNEKVSLSFSSWQGNEPGQDQAVVIADDGSEVILDEASIVWSAESPIDVDSVQSITIGDFTIDFTS